MMATGGSRRSRLVIGGVAVALPLALSACSGGSPAGTAVPAGAAAAAGNPAAAAVPQGVTNGQAVKVPRYVAADNARKDVTTTGCAQVGQAGWRLTGTATNTASARRAYSIVVDFVTPKGDTVLDTKVVSVGPVAPNSTVHWSATGAAGQGEVTCVIRQALAKA